MNRRRKRTPWQVPDSSLADVIGAGELPPAAGTLDLSITPFAPYPQLQRLGLLVDLMSINPVPRPVQNSRDLVICRQTASLPEISKFTPSHTFLRRARFPFAHMAEMAL